MKPAHHPAKRSGYTRADLMVVLGLLVLLTLLLAPGMVNARHQAQRSQCANHLSQFGMATKQWALDHADRYPWHTPAEAGGTWSNGAAWVHFNLLSNYVGTPKVFHCPADAERRPAGGFAIGQADSLAALTNRCLSYGIAMHTGSSPYRRAPRMSLAMDRNLTGYQMGYCGVVRFTVAKLRINDRRFVPRWTTRLHDRQGNVLQYDGSVHLMNQSNLINQLREEMPPGAGDASSQNCTLIP